MKNKKQIIVAVSGYFDPVHSGHINYLREARKLGDKLIVIVNNNKQAKLKKGHYFMPVEERKIILESIKYVDKVFISIDNTKDVSKSLRKIKPDIFAVGVDNNKKNLYEKNTCKELGIKIIDKLAKHLVSDLSLKQSSSRIIDKFLKKKGIIMEQE